jgi:hypothetical protein
MWPEAWHVRVGVAPDGRSRLVLGLPQHPDEHRPERPVLLAVDQELGEGAALRVAPELSDPVRSLEVGKYQSRTERVEALLWPAL